MSQSQEKSPGKCIDSSRLKNMSNKVIVKNKGQNFAISFQRQNGKRVVSISNLKGLFSESLRGLTYFENKGDSTAHVLDMDEKFIFLEDGIEEYQILNLGMKYKVVFIFFFK